MRNMWQRQSNALLYEYRCLSIAITLKCEKRYRWLVCTAAMTYTAAGWLASWLAGWLMCVCVSLWVQLRELCNVIAPHQWTTHTHRHQRTHTFHAFTPKLTSPWSDLDHTDLIQLAIFWTLPPNENRFEWQQRKSNWNDNCKNEILWITMQTIRKYFSVFFFPFFFVSLWTLPSICIACVRVRARVCVYT